MAMEWYKAAPWWQATLYLVVRFLIAARIVLHGYLLSSRRLRAQLKEQRMQKCESCFMFDHKNKTCGTIGNWSQRGLLPRGCWCYMPFAAQFIGKTCWRDSRGLPFGWEESKP